MKKINYFWIAFLFLFGIATGYFGKKYWNYKEKTNTKTHRVGFIFPEKDNVVTLDTAKAHWHKKILGDYSSAAPKIYQGSKYQFKERLFTSFNADKYKDNGYFNLRFYISNEGKVWLYEFNEMDFDFNPIHFSPGLKEELIELSFKQDNWNPYSEEDLNYYMHLTYRIENGKITEIIP